MFIVIQCVSFEDAVQLARDFAEYLTDQDILCPCMSKDNVYEGIVLKDFKDSVLLDLALVHAQALDFHHLAIDVAGKLRTCDCVICINYYNYNDHDLRMHNKGAHPDLVFHLKGANPLKDEHIQSFCKQNGFNYIPVMPGAQVDIKLLLVNVTTKVHMIANPRVEAPPIVLNCQTCGRTQEERDQSVEL